MTHTQKTVDLPGTSFSPCDGVRWVVGLVCCHMTFIYMADQVSWGKSGQFMQFQAEQDGFISGTKLKTTLGELYLHSNKEYHAYISLQ